MHLKSSRRRHTLLHHAFQPKTKHGAAAWGSKSDETDVRAKCSGRHKTALPSAGGGGVFVLLEPRRFVTPVGSTRPALRTAQMLPDSFLIIKQGHKKKSLHPVGIKKFPMGLGWGSRVSDKSSEAWSLNSSGRGLKALSKALGMDRSSGLSPSVGKNKGQSLHIQSAK